LLDLTKTGSHKINSMLDLVGVTIRVPKNATASSSGTGSTGTGGTGSGGTGSGGMGTGGTGTGGTGTGGTGATSNSGYYSVQASFPDLPASEMQILPLLADHVTTNPVPAIPGRININQASRTVLLGIPGMTSDMVDQIISTREPEFTGQHPEMQYETWLYTLGIVTLDQMKALEPFITTGGSVYRGQIVGYFDDGGPSHRVEVVVDASPLNANNAITLTSPNSQTTTDQSTTGTDPSSSTGTSSSSTTTSSTSTQPVIGVPRILFWRDISHLGRGFSLDTLGAGAG
jgi:hypothetical protein